jgi:hypothetical protein
METNSLFGLVEVLTNEYESIQKSTGFNGNLADFVLKATSLNEGLRVNKMAIMMALISIFSDNYPLH